MKKLAGLWFAIALVAVPGALSAAAPAPAIAMPEALIAEIRAWSQDPVLVAEVKAQNARHAALDGAAIDGLDQRWRAETITASRPLIDAVLANPASAYLKQVKQRASGLYTEIFVMDNRGLNVGQSDVTSDYWQGDEAKWQKSYGAGAGGLLVDEVEFDESTQTYQCQVSVAMVDPASQAVIGAVTVGVNVEMLD
jgi:hypothetical protein